MKKTLILTAIICFVFSNLSSVNAQVIIIMKDGSVVDKYNTLQYDKVVFEEEQEPTAEDINILKGQFTVDSSGKRVHFCKSNLYWDGSDYHFEKMPTDYPSSWDSSHVGHFYWTSLKDYHTDDAGMKPYEQVYSYSSQSLTDMLFCNEENPLTVDGVNGLFALSEDEWNYVVFYRENADKLHRYGVTVGDKKNCLIIAPDNFNGTLRTNYTPDKINTLGLVCLPAAGCRDGLEFNNAEIWGLYWSSTSTTNAENGGDLYFSSSYVYSACSMHSRGNGYSIRLVKR